MAGATVFVRTQEAVEATVNVLGADRPARRPVAWRGHGARCRAGRLDWKLSIQVFTWSHADTVPVTWDKSRPQAPA